MINLNETRELVLLDEHVMVARSREEGLEKGLVKEREEERLQLNHGMRKMI